jgi:hypothetical protein
MADRVGCVSASIHASKIAQFWDDEGRPLRVLAVWERARQGVRAALTPLDLVLRARLEQISCDLGLAATPAAPSEHPERLWGAADVEVWAHQAAIAPISGLMPMMFMTRVRL